MISSTVGSLLTNEARTEAMPAAAVIFLRVIESDQSVVLFMRCMNTSTLTRYGLTVLSWAIHIFGWHLCIY